MEDIKLKQLKSLALRLQAQSEPDKDDEFYDSYDQFSWGVEHASGSIAIEILLIIEPQETKEKLYQEILEGFKNGLHTRSLTNLQVDILKDKLGSNWFEQLGYTNNQAKPEYQLRLETLEKLSDLSQELGLYDTDYDASNFTVEKG